MNIFYKIYCRVYQLGFRIALPFLPYRDPKIYNRLEDIGDIFAKLHINNIFLVTDSFLKQSGATKPLEDILVQSAASKKAPFGAFFILPQ